MPLQAIWPDAGMMLCTPLCTYHHSLTDLHLHIWAVQYPISWAHLAGAGVGQSRRLHPPRNGGWRPEKPHESTVPLLRQGHLHLGSLLQARAVPEDLCYEMGYPSGHLKPSRHLSSSKWGVRYLPALVMTARPGESEGWCLNLQTGTERPGAARRHQQRSCCVGRRPKNCGPECRAQPAHRQCCLATVTLDTLVRRRCIH